MKQIVKQYYGFVSQELSFKTITCDTNVVVILYDTKENIMKKAKSFSIFPQFVEFTEGEEEEGVQLMAEDILPILQGATRFLRYIKE